MMQVDIQQRPKTFVVINPVAGKTEAAAVRDKVQAALEAHGIPFEIYETTRQTQTTRFGSQWQGRGRKEFLCGQFYSVLKRLVG